MNQTTPRSNHPMIKPSHDQTTPRAPEGRAEPSVARFVASAVKCKLNVPPVLITKIFFKVANLEPAGSCDIFSI